MLSFLSLCFRTTLDLELPGRRNTNTFPPDGRVAISMSERRQFLSGPIASGLKVLPWTWANGADSWNSRTQCCGEDSCEPERAERCGI